MYKKKSEQTKIVIFCLFWRKKSTIVYADFECNTLGILAISTSLFLSKSLQKGYILPFFAKKKRTIVYADFECNALGILAFSTAVLLSKSLQKGYILPFLAKKKERLSMQILSVTL